MVFEPQALAPGPGIGVQAMATFRWCPFRSVLNGSLFLTPGSAGVHHSF